MPSFKSLAMASIALFVGVRAQYYIDPATIDSTTRNSWCESQQAACPLLCLQLPGSSSTTADNSCDPDTLAFSCVCGNGLSPNASEYSQTIPYFECTQWVQNCIAGCNSQSACQSSCQQDHPCGAQSPKRVNTTSTITSASQTGAGASSTPSVFNGFAGAASTTPAGSVATSSPKSGATAVELGRTYGLAVVLSGVFAGFAVFM